jgi:hypothetical protein
MDSSAPPTGAGVDPVTPPIQWGGPDNTWPGNGVMRKPMDTDELGVLMHRLGDEGPTELARRLRVGRTTAWRWITGEKQMSNANAALLRLMAARVSNEWAM